jgi:ribose 5-phosphate isomerase A
MSWNSKNSNQVRWNDPIVNYEEKVEVATRIVERVVDHAVIGAGSGSTCFLALQQLAKEVARRQLSPLIVPTSFEIGQTCRALGLRVGSLLDGRPSVYFDGADEVDPHNRLIKGRGGALLREKVLMSACRDAYIVVDGSKLVPRLGKSFPIPVEVMPEAAFLAEERLLELGAADILVRYGKGKDGPIITENGNLLLDCRFDEVAMGVSALIDSIPGVVGHGLFEGFQFTLVTPSER